jgi:hypothetical protein
MSVQYSAQVIGVDTITKTTARENFISLEDSLEAWFIQRQGTKRADSTDGTCKTSERIPRI